MEQQLPGPGAARGEAQGLLSRAFHDSVLAAAVVDRDLHVLAVNGAFVSAFGPSDRPVLRLASDGEDSIDLDDRGSILDVVHPVDRPLTRRHLAEVRDARVRSAAVDARVLRAGGPSAWAQLVISPISMPSSGEDISAEPARESSDGDSSNGDRSRDGQSGPDALLIQVNDLNRHRQSAESFDVLFDDSPVGMFVADIDGRWTHVNSALCSMFGRSAEDLVSRSIEVNHLADVESDRAMLHQLVAGELPVFRREKRYLHRNGDIIWGQLTMSLVRGPGGEADHCLGQIVDVTDQRDAEERIRHLALHDPLTNMANRTLVMDRIEQAKARTLRRRDTMALFHCDLDDFNLVNDGLGHEVGDQLIVGLARRFGEDEWFNATIGRIGGDEFLMVCEALKRPDDAKSIAQRLSGVVAEPFSINGETLQLSMSIGVATLTGTEAETTTTSDLLRDADTALYRAKKGGRGAIEIFTAEFRSHAVARLQAEVELRRAVDEEQFTLRYQPIVRLATEETIGVEALLRWEHPERGQLQPREFLAAAEDTELLAPISTWALETACREIAALRAETGVALDLAVNLSASQLDDPGFVRRLEQMLAVCGLPGGALSLELTESTLIDNAMALVNHLTAIRDMGVRVAIDDFGTGWSSLAYLQRFPIDILKVDRMFTARLLAGDTAIVHAVVQLGAALQIAVVVEGIEAQGEATILREMGCEAGQGYLFGEAMTLEQLRVVLASSPKPGT